MSCGKEAPQRIVAAAKKNAVPGSGTPQRAGGAWAHGPPGKSAAGGRNGGYGTSSGKDKDKDGDPTTGDTLRALIAKLTKIGEVDLAKPLQAKLDEVVRQQREEKPISQTLRAIERKISDKKLTIEGYGSRIIAAETDVERTQQKLQREREGKAARETELAGLQRELEEATKGAQTATGMGSPTVPEDLRTLSPDISATPDVAAAMETVQKAVDAARLAAKAAQEQQEKQKAERDAAMSTAVFEEAIEGLDQTFEDTQVDAVVEELRKGSEFAHCCGSDGQPDRGRVRTFMEAMVRGSGKGKGERTGPYGRCG